VEAAMRLLEREVEEVGSMTEQCSRTEKGLERSTTGIGVFSRKL